MAGTPGPSRCLLRVVRAAGGAGKTIVASVTAPTCLIGSAELAAILIVARMTSKNPRTIERPRQARVDE